MIPLWQFALITLAACGTGGVIVCGLFYLGMKHGIEKGFKESKDIAKKSNSLRR